MASLIYSWAEPAVRPTARAVEYIAISVELSTFAIHAFTHHDSRSTHPALLLPARDRHGHLVRAFQIRNQVAHFLIRHRLQQTFGHHGQFALGKRFDLVAGDNQFLPGHYDGNSIGIL